MASSRGFPDGRLPNHQPQSAPHALSFGCKSADPALEVVPLEILARLPTIPITVLVMRRTKLVMLPFICRQDTQNAGLTTATWTFVPQASHPTSPSVLFSEQDPQTLILRCLDSYYRGRVVSTPIFDIGVRPSHELILPRTMDPVT